MTDKELDDLTVKLARQVTIKMCRQAADAIIDLRERIAALEKEQTELDKVRYDEIMALREQNGALSERIAALERTLTSVRIAIVSVLCDHDENPCFVGSQGDLAVIRAAIKDIDAARAALDATDSSLRT